MTLEVAFGRWLACITHPQAAWRQLRPRGRAILVGSYFGVGYVASLVVLVAVS